MMIALTSLIATPAFARNPHDFTVEATYLTKFGPFVQWPENSFENATAPFSICIVGSDPFGVTLDEMTHGQPINGHPVLVRRVEAVEPGLNCQILYAGGEKTDEALRKIAHEPTLTVTDGIAGGIIQFATIRGRVRFSIDQAGAQESGLIISSKLLGLAVQVKR